MPSLIASSTPRTASPSTARPCAKHRKNPPSVESLTPTPPSEPLKLSMGATVRDHRNAVRDRSESLSAIDGNDCPHSPESAFGKIDRHADISSVPAGWTSFLFRFPLGSRHLAAGADEAACGFSGAGKLKRKIKYREPAAAASRARRLTKVINGGE